MVKRRRTWSSLSVAALSGTALVGLLSACGPGEGGEGAKKPGAVMGEGEGGEGEGRAAADAPAVDLASDDTAYLTQLGLIRGHLHVGMALQRAGFTEMAKTHMKHPHDELYAALETAFVARGVVPFGEAMSALGTAVETAKPIEEIEAAYARFLNEIAAAEAAVGEATKTSHKARFALAVNLLRVAGDEYAIGVKDKAVVNVHEYQDAWGFLETAKAKLEAVTAEERGAAAGAYDAALAEMAKATPLFAGLDGTGTLSESAALLYGIAARVEIEALALPN